MDASSLRGRSLSVALVICLTVSMAAQDAIPERFAQPVRDLEHTGWTKRLAALELILADWSWRSNPAVRQALVDLLRRENALLADNWERGIATSRTPGEGYTHGYYSEQLLPAVMSISLIHGRAAKVALLHSAYAPHSPFAQRLAYIASDVLDEVMRLARSPRFLDREKIAGVIAAWLQLEREGQVPRDDRRRELELALQELARDPHEAVRRAAGPQSAHEARLKIGFRAAAELLGRGYVEEIFFDEHLVVADLRSVAEQSEIVIRGLVTSNISELVRQHERGFRKPIETIVTNYTVAVLDVYKGDPARHSHDITVRIPGGRVEFEAGLWAEVRVSYMALPQNQEEFILFLHPHESVPSAYSVTFGRQGLFKVTPDGRVVPGATHLSPLWRNTRKDLAGFLEQLNDAVGRRERH